MKAAFQAQYGMPSTVRAFSLATRDGERGIEVVTGAGAHEIDVTLDCIGRKRELTHTSDSPCFVKNGTFSKLHWPGIASSLDHAKNASSYEGDLDGFEICTAGQLLSSISFLQFIDSRHSPKTFAAASMALRRLLSSAAFAFLIYDCESYLACGSTSS